MVDKSKQQVNKENVNLNLKSPYNIFGYRVIFDKLKNIKVILNIYKGETLAGRELQETDKIDKKLKVVKLKVRFENKLTHLIEPIDNLQVRELIEDLNLDFSILEKWFIRTYGKYITKKILSQVVDKLLDDKHYKAGDLVAQITMDYEEFVKLVNFLKLLIDDYENKRVNI